MGKLKLFFTLLICFFFTSCIPTKDLIYLQKNDSKSDTQPVESVNQKPYRVQVNDILSITIKAMDSKYVEIFNYSNISSQQGLSEQTAYFNGYTVDDHGDIRMPVLGLINVLGKTTEEIRVIVEEKLLKEYFTKEAGVFVSVKLSGFRYVVNGEIGNAGTKILYQDKVNILEAIANSGDITITGDRKDVIVMRRFPYGTETFHIDLTNSNAVNSPVYNLHPNDYIYVKPLKQKTWGTGKTGIESLSTLITLLSLATTTFLLLRN
ncbi:polysaccharide biosynthesis/export family protein [Flavobacterium capsici]|uniref:Polysaccharide biosynthesis/export family protein n=1 Tax=Flavobacterium capsici TaxID=3075618 RepID=A0AA96J5E2_9FLAO|nr:MULTISPECIES: polysaccharide biosynthesis/export family protein [unclassified Flavobacterium]WNM20208.1 polysaccharide biosynthesis/export family protein [Flavobacterium sp. PMR2A8]WNM21598.1 polysaccharide biosynthesis/export family protein [Flavobacterium sp. PMTSA4]